MKKSLKKAGLYDPYLDTLGGGERYAISILKVFESLGCSCSIFWDSDLSKEIQDKFSIRFKKLSFIPKIFLSSTLKTLWTLKTFDYFIYVTDGSYFFSSAKNNIVYAMVPQKNLYSKSWLNRFKIVNWKFITHSRFNQNVLKQLNIPSRLLYPFINIDNESQTTSKEQIILSVGRFFPQLHTKRHDKLIHTFKKLKQNYHQFHNYKLILAGGLKNEDKKYFNQLIQMSENDTSIIFRPNLSFDELNKLYRKASYFWHFTGYGINPVENPELVEHLGLTPLEAMAHRCLVFCYRAGGPEELIIDHQNGFLFDNEEELIMKINQTESNIDLQNAIRKSAFKYVKTHFSYDTFFHQVQAIFVNQK